MDVNGLWKPVKASLRPKASRLVIAPCICKCCHLKPSSMIVGGASVASLACISASVWPTELPALLLGVSGVAVGVGPSYAMCISMAKERRELTSVDSAMFAVASSLGAGGVPFVMSRVLSRFGPPAFFPTLLGMSVALVVLTTLLRSSSGARQRKQTERKLKEMSAFVEEEDTSESTCDGSFCDGHIRPIRDMWESWGDKQRRRAWHASATSDLDILGARLDTCSSGLPNLHRKLGIVKSRADPSQSVRQWPSCFAPRFVQMGPSLGTAGRPKVRSCEISSSQEVRWHLGGCDPVQQCPNHAMVGRIEAIKKTALPNRTKWARVWRLLFCLRARLWILALWPLRQLQASVPRLTLEYFRYL